MTDNEDFAELLLELRADDPVVRSGAAAALSAFGTDGTAAIGPLLAACRDPDESVREAAVCSLRDVAVDLVGVVPGAERGLVAGVPTLVSLLDDPSECICCASVETLKRMGPVASAALPRLRKLACDRDPYRRMAAAEAITVIAAGQEAGRDALEAVSFVARRVSLDEQFCTMVTFDSGGPDYLVFQRDYPPDPDEETGEMPAVDPVYLERDDQAWAARGGVESCILGRDALYLRVSPATAARLRGAEEFRIGFAVGDAEFARLRELMRVIFRGDAAYRLADAEPGAAADGGGG